MKLLRVLAPVLCAYFLATACIGDILSDIFGPDTPTPTPPEEKTYTLTVTPNGTVEFPAEGGSKEFKATTNADNTGCNYPKNDWLSVKYDKTSKVYVVSVDANESGSDREFELSFYAKNSGSDEKVATKVVKGIQKYVEPTKARVWVNPAALDFAGEGGTESTVVTWSTGMEYLRASPGSSVKSWVTVEWRDIDGSKYLFVTAQPNDTGQERSGIIKVYAGVTKEDITNAQNGDMDSSRAAVVDLAITQAAGNGQGGSGEGALSGVFSVDGNGHKVVFSQGNLQYQASTNTWRFAEKQWTYVGNDNSKIGKSYSGWIDLFGWGTSGYNCGNYYYQPYDYTLKADYYYSGGMQYGPKGSTSLTGSNAKSDWGVYNAISNGGKQAGLWRTITHNEFDYLIFKRSTTSGIRFAKAVVNNINGLILFPDNWNKSTYSINKANEESANYSSNSISSSNWTKLENAGCVFLPAAGVRYAADYETTVNLMTAVGTSGEYWTASGDATEADADHLLFYEEGLQFRSWPRYEGRSVRLVKDK